VSDGEQYIHYFGVCMYVQSVGQSIGRSVGRSVSHKEEFEHYWSS